MPFSSLSDPANLARACAALDAAWDEIKTSQPDMGEQDRIRLAYIVAGLVALAVDPSELVERAVAKFREVE